MANQQPRQTEPIANNALGALLRRMLPGCNVLCESTRTVVGHSGRHPDVLITAPGRSPVVVEAEYEPAPEAESDAAQRLGLDIAGESRPVEAAIALRYPAEVGDAYDVDAAVAGARLSYAVLYDDGARFSESGWLQGSAADLADLIRLVSVPQRAVDLAAEALEQGIERAAAILNEMAALRPNIAPAVARLLGMADVPQTRRMAGAIIANALVFHQRIAGMYPQVKPLRLVCGPGVADPQGETLAAWGDILNINYWPIFSIARDLLEQLPAGDAARILAELRETAQQIDAAGVTNAHDLTGRIFQRLIADRKYLATFYTLPASAALLARLAVAKLTPSPLVGEGRGEGGIDWSNSDAIAQLRIADFACGTGALLSAVYEQIAGRHERAGGHPANLHAAMMEDALHGCDVMPSAIHITGSTLSGAQPNVGFGKSRLYTLAYGRQQDGSVSIGSLELLQSSSAMTLFNTSDPAQRTGSVGEETAAQIIADIPDEGFDLVIMNPPFTRNTGQEAAHIGVFNPAFAAFEASDADQRDMSKRMTELTRGTCYHGNAGIASAFAALGDKKLKPGGVLALVLPLSAAAGLSWQGFRQMLESRYTDITVLSIAANGRDMSFSSDTGMAECLVIARKSDVDVVNARISFASLRRRPQGFAESSAVAGNIIDRDDIKEIEAGPYGGAYLTIGNDMAGEMLTAPQSGDGENWGSVRLYDYSLAQTAYALSNGKLWLPGEPAALELPTELLGNVGQLGTYHLDISGPAPRAPFARANPSPTATYPCLWNHDARKETRIVCEPDSQLQVRTGLESKAANVWATASRAHLNRDFRFNSQPLTVAFTEQKSMGGISWPNVIFDDPRFDYAFAIWANSTLGLLAYWWHANKQQDGRGRTTIRAAESLPTLDFRMFQVVQLLIAEEIFNDFREKELQPAYLSDADANRALLDRRVVCDLLGFDDATYQAVRRLSAKWCAEPSVHGGKRRPRGMGMVV